MADAASESIMNVNWDMGSRSDYSVITTVIPVPELTLTFAGFTKSIEERDQKLGYKVGEETIQGELGCLEEGVFVCVQDDLYTFSKTGWEKVDKIFSIPPNLKSFRKGQMGSRGSTERKINRYDILMEEE